MFHLLVFEKSKIFSFWSNKLLGRISCRSFWIQNGVWAILGYCDICKTVLDVSQQPKYRSDTVLYSKRMAGYPQSPHIKIIYIYIYIYTSYFRRGGKSVVLEYTNGVRSERIIKYYYRLNRDHFSMLWYLIFNTLFDHWNTSNAFGLI